MKATLLRLLSSLQRILLPLGLHSSRTLAGQRIHFDPATDIGMWLTTTGRFERNALALAEKYIPTDGLVLDIGANIGTHAVHFAAKAREGRVICFEPSRETFALLLRNVGNLPNVLPLNLALSKDSGVQTFFIANDNAYSSLKDTGRKPIVRRESVACYAADQILPPLLDGKRIDLVKIDVEGFELQVLQGMRELISTHRPVIFCEICGAERQNPDPEGTVKHCVSQGYDAYVVDGASLVPAGPHDDNLQNYFFIPRGAGKA